MQLPTILPYFDAVAGACLAELEAGELDTCLHLLRREDCPIPNQAALNCRLAEKLFYRGRHDDALECGRRAQAQVPEDDETAHFCAWLFSNCGCHGEAAAAYQRLLDRAPDWVEGYRHASGSLAAIGASDSAISHAARASDLAPGRGEFALHTGRLLLNAGRWADATLYLRRAVTAEPDDASALRELSSALFAAGERGEAITLALRAVDLAPRDTATAIHAGELLLRCERVDEAAALIGAVASDTDNPTAFRVLSSIEMVRDRPREALAAIDRALALDAPPAEYQLHRGHVLYRLGDPVGAADAFGRAAELDATSRDAKRAQLAAFLAGGRLSEATALGGELLRGSPDDEDTAEAVLELLNRRLDLIDGDYVVLADRTLRPQRESPPPPRFLDGMRCQCRVLHALILRETRTRFGDAKLGYGWALIEPVLHIALLSAMFSLLMHGQPPIGGNFFLFYYTGLIPYQVFVHTSTNMAYAITSNGALLNLPHVTTFDVTLARGLLEFTTDVLVAAILLIGLMAIGIASLPDDMWAPCAALLVTAALGGGIGFLNAVLTVLCKSWDKIWVQVTRVLYFGSGIFFVPGMMPDWVRDVLAWNPLLHAIDWFRAGFFGAYQPHWLDRSYVVGAAIVAVLAGLGIERGLRRRLSEPL